MKKENKTKTISFRITEQELMQLDGLIETVTTQNQATNPSAKPVNRNQVLEVLVRNYINLGPSFLNEELLSLSESNRLLLAIGRNLNQVVKRINTGEVSADILTENYLSQLAKHVNKVRQHISILIEHNKKRGQVELGDPS